jgi:hypothetical protein
MDNDERITRLEDAFNGFLVLYLAGDNNIGGDPLTNNPTTAKEGRVVRAFIQAIGRERSAS